MADFSATIKRLGGNRSYTVQRFPRQRFTDGKLDPQEASELPITALIVPASGKDLLRLAEGDSASQVVAIFTETALLVSDEENQQPPDRVLYLGAPYQVETCEPWAEVGNYYKALARKVKA